MTKEELDDIYKKINEEASTKLEKQGYLTLDEVFEMVYENLGTKDPMSLLEIITR